MRYVNPVGVQGADNAYGKDYVDKNAGAGVKGSYVAAEFFKSVGMELAALITKAGLTPDVAILDQVLRAIRRGKLNYVVAGGTADAMTVTLDPVPAGGEIAAGFYLAVLSPGVSTVITPTLAVNGGAATPIIDAYGVNLRAGDARGILYLVHDGTYWRLLNIDALMRTERNNLAVYSGFASGTNDSGQLIRAIRRPQFCTANVTGAPNAYFVTLSPGPAAGEIAYGFQFKAWFHPGVYTNTGPATININGVVYDVWRGDHTTLQPGDLNGMIELTHDSARFLITGQMKPALSTQTISGLLTTFNPVVYQVAGVYSYTVPAGCYALDVHLGGGGGGGSSGGTVAASGGGAGGYAYKRCSVTPGQVISVTVGAGGTCPGGNAAGNAGGTSSFGAFFSATGGGGGVANGSGGGASGNGSGGDINIFGGGGFTFPSGIGVGGQGGGGSWGNGGIPTATVGGIGATLSSGGAGGYANNIGGVGAPGFCIIVPTL